MHSNNRVHTIPMPNSNNRLRSNTIPTVNSTRSSLRSSNSINNKRRRRDIISSSLTTPHLSSHIMAVRVSRNTLVSTNRMHNNTVEGEEVVVVDISSTTIEEEVDTMVGAEVAVETKMNTIDRNTIRLNSNSIRRQTKDNRITGTIPAMTNLLRRNSMQSSSSQ